LPRLSQFKNKAIFADLTALPARLDTRHRIGVNVLYGDGSAHWVRRATFDQALAPCNAINAKFNPNQDVIWDALDRKSKTIRLCDFEAGWLKALFDAENLGDNPFRATFDLSTNLEEKVRKAKLINEHVVPPVSKRHAKASALLAAVGI